MEDPVLNKSLEETIELQTRWNQFREFIRMAIERGKVPPEAEMKFLELKSFIAMLHDGFMAKLEHSQKTGQNIMSIVGDCILLSRIAQYNEAERQKFEFDWNECFMLITEQVQALEDEKKRLATISKSAVAAQQRKERISTMIYNFIHGAPLKWTITALVIFMLFYGIPAFIWSYRNFRQVPVVGEKIYVPLVNAVYRPYMDANYRFDKWEDIPLNPEEEPAPIRELSNAELTKNYFSNTVIFELGASQTSAPELRDLLSKTLQFQTERFTAQGDDSRFFYMLFPESAQAQRFVQILQDDFRARNAEQQEQIMDSVYIARNANFLAIGISKHPIRDARIKKRFELDGEWPNEFQF